MRFIVALSCALISGLASFFLFGLLAGGAPAIVVGLAVMALTAMVFLWAVL